MLRQCFEYVDQDGSGFIDAGELATVFRLLKLPATITAAQRMINAVDADGNGTVSFSEFVHLIEVQLAKQSDDAGASEVFRREFKPVRTHASPVTRHLSRCSLILYRLLTSAAHASTSTRRVVHTAPCMRRGGDCTTAARWLHERD